MAAPARIDELRHRYAEQPRRYFAPLANALRRSGALEEAVTMLRAQLAEHPDHLTGHVVLGQALFDTGALADAQTAFETARTLDPGNRVVLRHLGDIASLAGDQAAARLWFGRLRAAEPYADDVAAQLGGGATQPPDVDEANESRAHANGTRVAAEDEVSAARGVANAPTPSVADAAAGARDTFASEAVVLDDAGRDDAGGSERFELLEFDAVSRDAPVLGDAGLDPVVGLDLAPPAPPVELVAGVGAAPAGEDDAAAALEHITAGPFATETMAGLLAAQGHTEQAVALYERLTAERPADAALRARLDALRGGPTPTTPSTPDHSDAGGATDADRGALLADAFADLAAARVASAVTSPVAAAVVASTHPAPANADASAEGDVAEVDLYEDVSFDHFFAHAPAVEDAADDAAAPAGRGGSRDAGIAGITEQDTGDDADLERFDVWLRGVA